VVQAALAAPPRRPSVEGDRQFNLAVRLDPNIRSSIDAVRNVKVRSYQTPSGTKWLRAAQRDCGHHARHRRILHLIANEASVSFRSSSACARAVISAVRSPKRRFAVAGAIKLPSGYQILWAGEFDDLQNAKKRLAIVVPITLL